MSLGSGITTGVVASNIAARVASVDAGSEVMSADINTTAQSIVNDLATIKVQWQRNDITPFALVAFGGSALETLGVTGSGSPSMVVGGSTLHGTLSSQIRSGVLSVDVGEAIEATAAFDYDMTTHAHDAVIALYALIDPSTIVAIPGALCVIPEGVTTTRTRMVLEGRLTAGTAGSFFVAAYAFLGGSDSWALLGGGALRTRVMPSGL